jgi:hypothetical protein
MFRYIHVNVFHINSFTATYSYIKKIIQNLPQCLLQNLYYTLLNTGILITKYKEKQFKKTESHCRKKKIINSRHI